MKKILLLAVAFGSFLCGCQSVPPSPEAVSITAVYTFNMGVLDNSNSPSAIVAKLKSVSLIGCPTDFVNAYNRYVNAWGGFANLEKKMYSENLKKADSTFANFIASYQDNPSEAVVKLKSEWKTLAPEIDTVSAELGKSFTDLKIIGTKYDVAYISSSWL